MKNCLDYQAEEEQGRNEVFEDLLCQGSILIADEVRRQIRVEICGCACRFVLHGYLQIAWVAGIINFHNFGISLTSNCLAALHGCCELGFTASSWAVNV